MSQRFDGIQIHSFFCGIETKKDAEGAGVSRRTDDGQTEEGSQGEKSPESETSGLSEFLIVAAGGSGKIVKIEVSNPGDCPAKQHSHTGMMSLLQGSHFVAPHTTRDDLTHILLEGRVRTNCTNSRRLSLYAREIQSDSNTLFAGVIAR